MKKKIFLLSAIITALVLLFDFYLYNSWLNLDRYTFSGNSTNEVFLGGVLTLLLLSYVVYKLYVVLKRDGYVSRVEYLMIILFIPLIYMYLFESCIYLNRDFGVVGLNYILIPLGFVGYIVLPYIISILIIKKTRFGK